MRPSSIFITLVLLSFLSSCATNIDISSPKLFESPKPLGISAFVDGWDSMIEQIESQNADGSQLKGQNFKLRIKLDGDWQLIIYPQEAFEIERERQTNIFNVEIIRPGALFESQGGLQKMVYIQAEIRKSGGEKGTIDLTADVECLFKVNFYQKNSEPVNFDRLLEAYEYDLVISPAQYLDVYSFNPEFVVLRRTKFMEEDATLRLLLVDKKTKETFYSSKVNVPHCGFSAKVALPEKEKYHVIKNPAQCLVHLDSLGSKYDTTKVHKIYAEEVFSNVCKFAVKCQLTAKYGYIKDKKIIEADTKVFDFKVEAGAVKKIDTSWNYINQQFEFDSKLYIASLVPKESVPENYELINQPGYLECLWDED